MNNSFPNPLPEPELEFSESLFIDDPVCPNCQTVWLSFLAPEYCPECGAFITDNHGAGDDDIVDIIQNKGLNIPGSKCIKCGLKCLGTPECWNNSCSRCDNKLVLITNYKPTLKERLINFLKSSIR